MLLCIWAKKAIHIIPVFCKGIEIFELVTRCMNCCTTTRTCIIYFGSFPFFSPNTTKIWRGGTIEKNSMSNFSDFPHTHTHTQKMEQKLYCLNYTESISKVRMQRSSPLLVVVTENKFTAHQNDFIIRDSLLRLCLHEY